MHKLYAKKILKPFNAAKHFMLLLTATIVFLSLFSCGGGSSGDSSSSADYVGRQVVYEVMLLKFGAVDTTGTKTAIVTYEDEVSQKPGKFNKPVTETISFKYDSSGRATWKKTLSYSRNYQKVNITVNSSDASEIIVSVSGNKSFNYGNGPKWTGFSIKDATCNAAWGSTDCSVQVDAGYFDSNGYLQCSTCEPISDAGYGIYVPPSNGGSGASCDSLTYSGAANDAQVDTHCQYAQLLQCIYNSSGSSQDKSNYDAECAIMTSMYSMVTNGWTCKYCK